MAGPIFTDEEKWTEYRELAAELSGLQWRIVAVLLGATFLLIFWFGSTLDLAFKYSAFISTVRMLMPFAVALNAMSWISWILPECMAMMRVRGADECDLARGDEESLLDKIDRAQSRLVRLARSYWLLSICAGLQFVMMATIMAIVAFGFGTR